MQIISCQQGSQEWLSIRAQHFTASEAPAMMGASKYMKRSELLHQKHTGIAPDVDAHKQALFDRGHAAEADARVHIQAFIGEDLSPVTGMLEVEGLPLLASFDGLNFEGDVAWESKLWNEALAKSIAAEDIEPHYYWQLEQQLLVSGASRVFFTTTDGTEEKMAGMWYVSKPELRAALIAGWHQFAKDLAAYVPPEVIPAAVAAPIMALPALSIQIKGEVTLSNLPQFREAAEQFIANIKTELVTDEDFADAEATVKFCDAAEKNLEQAKSAAIAQTASIDELMRTIDHIKKQISTKRLILDKLVKSEKEARKAAIVADAQHEFLNHLDELYKETKPIELPIKRPDFGGAMKGLKKLSAMKEAVGKALRDGMFEADTVAKDIRAKLAGFKVAAYGYEFLFNDLQQIINKPAEDFQLVVTTRIDAHKAAEAAKLEAERQRIRAEEEAKARAAANHEAARLEAIRHEEARVEAEQAAKPSPPLDISAPVMAEDHGPTTMPASEPSKAVALNGLVGRPTQQPSRTQLIDVVALAFGVAESTAADWLVNEFQQRAA